MPVGVVSPPAGRVVFLRNVQNPTKSPITNQGRLENNFIRILMFSVLHSSFPINNKVTKVSLQVVVASPPKQ
jgi:hypothetical protein